MRRIASLFHQRNGDRTGRDHIGHGRAADRSLQSAGHNGRLGRTADAAAAGRGGKAGHPVADAAGLEEGRKYHEQEDKRRGNVDRGAEDALRAQPFRANHALECKSCVEEEERSRDQMSEKCVEQEHRADADHDHAGHTARSLQQQEDRNATDDDVRLRKRTGAQQQVVVEDHMVKADADAGKRQGVVIDRNMARRLCGFARNGIEEINQSHSGGQMRRTLESRGEGAEQARIQLENGPCDTKEEYELGGESRQTAVGRLLVVLCH